MEEQIPVTRQDKPAAMPPAVPSTSTGVMDVHRPKPAEPEQPGLASADPASANDLMQTPADEHQTPPAEQPTAHTSPQPDSHHLLAAHAGKKRQPMMAILLAVVLALVLAGVAAYAYTQSNKTKTPEDHTNHTATQQAPETTADEDINTLSSDIDKMPTTADDNKDLPESDLTDQALGI